MCGADAALVAKVLRRVEQGARHLRTGGVGDVGPHEELRTCSWRKRHGGYELGVVGEPVLLVGVCPVPVEDVLSVAVSLHVETESAEEGSSVLAEEVDRRPPARSANAARVLERAQKLEVEERKVRRLEGAPRRSLYVLDAEEPLYLHRLNTGHRVRTPGSRVSCTYP